MKIIAKIVLVFLFSAFYVYSPAQKTPLAVKLSETHVSCNAACDGEIVTNVFGNGPYTYEWSNGSEESSISNLCPGTYTVVVRNPTGGKAKATVRILEPAPITGEVLITPQSLYIECNGALEITNVKGGTPPYSFAWNTGFSEPNYLGICDGLYTIIVSDKKDCFTEIDIELTGTKNCDNIVSDNSNFTTFCKPPVQQEEFIESNIFPNPFSSQATLEFSVKNSSDLKILLYNSNGTLLKTLFNQNVRNDLTYQVSLNAVELKSGLYYYRIIAGNSNQSKSFIVVN